MGFFLRLVTRDPFKQIGAYCLKFGKQNGPSYTLEMKNGKIVYNSYTTDVEVWGQNPDDPDEFGVTAKTTKFGEWGYAVYTIRPNEPVGFKNGRIDFENVPIRDLKVIPKEVADELVRPVVKQLEAVFG